MKLVLASGNLHKAEEIRDCLPETFDIRLQSEFDVTPADETGSTFVENALIKAKHAAEITGLPVISDDSGICVEALGGAPGIFSARYAGTDASDQDNVEKLLAALGDTENRAAYFYCVLVYMADAGDPTPLIAEARWSGSITNVPSGTSGFGYDPVFRPDKSDQTAAEIGAAEKNRISHRGQALKLLAQKLSERYSL